LHDKIEIIDVLGVVYVLNKAIKVTPNRGCNSGKKCSTSGKNQYSMRDFF
jgi:hypothetical protein